MNRIIIIIKWWFIHKYKKFCINWFSIHLQCSKPCFPKFCYQLCFVYFYCFCALHSFFSSNSICLYLLFSRLSLFRNVCDTRSLFHDVLILLFVDCYYYCQCSVGLNVWFGAQAKISLVFKCNHVKFSVAWCIAIAKKLWFLKQIANQWMIFIILHGMAWNWINLLYLILNGLKEMKRRSMKSKVIMKRRKIC